MRARLGLVLLALAASPAVPLAWLRAQAPAESDERQLQIRARQRLVAHQKRVDRAAAGLVGALDERAWRDSVRYLGVRVADHEAGENRLLAEALGVPDAEHPFVYSVDPTGPADAADLQPGDQILTFGGEDVRDAKGFYKRGRRSDLPSPLAVRVLRDGSEMDLELGESWRPRGLEVLVSGDGANVYAFTNEREIVISTGMLNRLLTDSELAVVLGHEIGHVVHRHFSTTYLQGGGQTYFSQDLEREADRFGLELAHRAGYDPAAAAAVWERFDAELPREAGAPWLLSHPPNRQRIAALRKTAEQLRSAAP